MNLDLKIQPATAGDVPAILSFIRGLAEFEKLSHRVSATEEKLRETLFGHRRYAEVLIARLSGQPVGQALFFHTYSTFMAQPGIYLEDLYVLPEHRSRGIGLALLKSLARVARQRNCGRLEWAVLDWNERAISFYRRIGADVLPDWRICRVDEETIQKLAGQEVE
jgi:GNAT superfamily N-acetyltransferase